MPFLLRDVFTWVDEAYPDGVPPEDSGTLVGLLRHRQTTLGDAEQRVRMLEGDTLTDFPTDSSRNGDEAGA